MKYLILLIVLNISCTGEVPGWAISECSEFCKPFSGIAAMRRADNGAWYCGCNSGVYRKIQMIEMK